MRLAHRELLDWSLIQASFCTTAGLGASWPPWWFPSASSRSSGCRNGSRTGSICGLLCWPPGHAVTAVVLYLMRSRPPILIALAAVVGRPLSSACLSRRSGTGCTAGCIRRARSPSRLGSSSLNLAVMALGVSALVHYVACQRARTRVAIAAGGAAGEAEAVPAHAPGCAGARSGGCRVRAGVLRPSAASTWGVT